MSPDVIDDGSRNILEFDEDSSYNSSRDINVTTLKSLKHYNNPEAGGII
jgi:hypothetical protein